MLEMERRGDVPPATRALAPAAEIPPPAAPAPADTTLSLMNELGELQRGLQASRSPAAAGSKPPGEADAAPAETTIVAAPAPAAAVLPPGPVAATPPPAAAVSPTLTVVDNRPASPGAEWVAAARPLQEDPATPGATPEAGAADPDEGLVPLDQLLREYEERIAAPLPAPATEPMTPAASPAEEPSEPATAPEGTAPETDAGFPVPVGGRTKIPEIDVASTNPLATAPAREALDEWAAELVSHPDVAIAVTVYGGGTDLEQALALSERHAESVRHYLVVAGAAAAQVQALGMGLDPEGAARVEIERLR
jgi:outer membrane protein OmpA-like peptidoglycan-associated protein